MKTKLAFFDIDGTLSAPYYPVEGELKPGMTDEQWITFCKEYGEDSYFFCKPVMPVKRYAEKLREQGAELYVLSTSQTPEEDISKVKFIGRFYSGLFQEVLTVRRDADKVGRILELAEQKKIEADACELVEDTYSNVLLAVTNGIRATHISQIVQDLQEERRE